MAAEPAREFLPLLAAGTAETMYLLLTVFGVVFVVGLYRRFHAAGIRQIVADVLQNPRRSLTQLIAFALGQRKVLGECFGGIMHAGLFAGALVLFIGTALVFLEFDVVRNAGLSFLSGPFYLGFEVSLDTFGLIYIAAILVAFFRRAGARPTWLENRGEYHVVLALLLYLGVTGFLLEGLRLALRPAPWGSWSIVGVSFAALFTNAGPGGSLGSATYQLLWWSHALITFGLVAAVPYSSLGHIFTSSVNVMIAPASLRGELPAPFNLQELTASGQFDVRVGINGLAEMSWQQRLGVAACTNCGRCESTCPATAAGTPLSPRRVVQNLKTALETGHSGALIDSVIAQGEIWACTTCGACIEACPVLINPMEYLVDFRRHLVAQGHVDKKQTTLLANLANTGNPYGLPPSDRMLLPAALHAKTLADNPTPEYVYWVGCAATYDPRARRIAESVVKLLNAAGVNYAIVAAEERCTGDPARRLGEEGRFQELAFQNIETLRQHDVRKIVTHCPHCFNTLANEYRQFGTSFDVVHHTQLIQQLLDARKLQPSKPLGLRTTLHDSCYLGRFNHEFAAPRKTLTVLPNVDLREMPRRREASFCCGAGGANYWYDVPQEQRISVLRAKEAQATGAEVLTVECPFCLQMFADATRTAGLDQQMQVRDLAELVADAL
jgi:Fe-S oxidoreductase/nitrate reductase gamma subunit